MLHLHHHHQPLPYQPPPPRPPPPLCTNAQVREAQDQRKLEALRQHREAELTRMQDAAFVREERERRVGARARVGLCVRVDVCFIFVRVCVTHTVCTCLCV